MRVKLENPKFLLCSFDVISQFFSFRPPRLSKIFPKLKRTIVLLNCKKGKEEWERSSGKLDEKLDKFFDS